MSELITRLWDEEEGMDLSEYALLLVLVSLVVVAAITRFGGTTASSNTHGNVIATS